MDYYDLLGVGRTATQEEIKKAYRKKAMEHHPDRGGDEKSFKEVQEAYDTLSDDGKRTNYDMYGKSDGRSPFGASFDFSDFFSGFGMNSPFGGPRQSPDVDVAIELTISEIISGSSKVIRYTRQDTCGDCRGAGGSKHEKCDGCGGTGMVVEVINHIFGHVRRQSVCGRCQGKGATVVDRCGKCRGEGHVAVQETVEVQVPRGAVSGHTLVMRGKGHARKDMAPGNLNIHINEVEDPRFRRSGLNILHTAHVSIPDAVLGCGLVVEAPTGAIRITVPPGCEPGKVLSVRGKGVPANGSGSVGDLLVTISVQVPKVLTEEQREIFERLKNII